MKKFAEFDLFLVMRLDLMHKSIDTFAYCTQQTGTDLGQCQCPLTRPHPPQAANQRVAWGLMGPLWSTVLPFRCRSDDHAGRGMGVLQIRIQIGLAVSKFRVPPPRTAWRRRCQLTTLQRGAKKLGPCGSLRRRSPYMSIVSSIYA